MPEWVFKRSWKWRQRKEKDAHLQGGGILLFFFYPYNFLQPSITCKCIKDLVGPQEKCSSFTIAATEMFFSNFIGLIFSIDCVHVT